MEELKKDKRACYLTDSRYRDKALSNIFEIGIPVSLE